MALQSEQVAFDDSDVNYDEQLEDYGLNNDNGSFNSGGGTYFN